MTALAIVSACALAPGADDLAGQLTGPSFPDALLAVATAAQLALALWVLTVVALSTTAWTGRAARVIAPAAVRHLLFVGAAGVVAVAPAHAEQVAVPGDHPPHSLDGLRLPDRPTSPVTGQASTAGVTRGADVVVRAGDTLWAIAAGSLPDGSTDADVARATQRWYAANRRVIGDDADLIIPGQRLARPLGKDHS